MVRLKLKKGDTLYQTSRLHRYSSDSVVDCLTRRYVSRCDRLEKARHPVYGAALCDGSFCSCLLLSGLRFCCRFSKPINCTASSCRGIISTTSSWFYSMLINHHIQRFSMVTEKPTKTMDHIKYRVLMLKRYEYLTARSSMG